jgi:hypothetical protein
MKLLTQLLFLILLPLLIHAQKSENLHQHYHKELKSFKEANTRSEQMSPDTNIDVKFYHLELDIRIGSSFPVGKWTKHIMKK